MGRKCSSENLIANRSILLEAREEVSSKKKKKKKKKNKNQNLSHFNPLHRGLGFFLCTFMVLNFFFFFFPPTFTGQIRCAKHKPGEPISHFPTLVPGMQSSHPETNPHPSTGEAAFILHPSGAFPHKQTLGLRSREASAESLPVQIAHFSTRAGGRSQACSTYLLPEASSPGARPTGR